MTVGGDSHARNTRVPGCAVAAAPQPKQIGAHHVHRLGRARLQGLHARQDRRAGAARRVARGRARASSSPSPGPSGSGQDHAPEPRRLRRHADRRARRRRRPGHRAPLGARAHRAPAPHHRLHLPELQPRLRAHGLPERGVPAAPAGRARRARSARTRVLRAPRRGRASPTTRGTGRASSPAGSGSASRSRARS